MYYLIGIGGSGARCMEAFINLLGAGLLDTDQKVKIAYVDADVNCGNLKQAMDRLELYTKINKAIDSRWNFGRTGYFKNPVERYEDYDPVPSDVRNMDGLFQINNLPQSEKEIGLIYQCLYKTKEGKTDLKEGFRGHPCIGAAIINDTLSESKFWEQLVKDIEKPSKDEPRVFIFASAFGGTGAAGFPNIAERIHGIRRKGDNQSLKIGGALLLPYFTFPSADGNDKEKIHAKSKEFINNTQEALKYYKEYYLQGENKVFDALYLIGDQKQAETATKGFKLGGVNQKNKAHYVELYAALAAYRFFNKMDADNKEGKGYVIARKELDTVYWDDLPEASKGGETTKVRLQMFTLFLYVYSRHIYKLMDENLDSPSKSELSWCKDLIGYNGSDIVTDDNKSILHENLERLNIMAENYFSWLREIPAFLVQMETLEEEKYLPSNLLIDKAISESGLSEKIIIEELNRIGKKDKDSYIKPEDEKKKCEGLGIFFSVLHDSIDNARTSEKPRDSVFTRMGKSITGLFKKK